MFTQAKVTAECANLLRSQTSNQAGQVEALCPGNCTRIRDENGPEPGKHSVWDIRLISSLVNTMSKNSHLPIEVKIDERNLTGMD